MTERQDTFWTVAKVVISLIAAGSGFAAWLTFFGPDRISTDVFVENESQYVLDTSTGGALAIIPKAELYQIVEDTPDTAAGVVALTLDFTNRGFRPVSLNRVTLVLEKIANLAPNLVMIEFTDSVDAELVSTLQLDVQAQGADWVRVRVPYEESVDAFKTRIQDTESPNVLAIYEDTNGATHKAFSRTETVDLKLTSDRLEYIVSLGQTIGSRDSLRVALRISAQEHLLGTGGQLVLRFDGDSSVEVFESVEIEVVPARLVEVVAADE